MLLELSSQDPDRHCLSGQYDGYPLCSYLNDARSDLYTVRNGSLHGPFTLTEEPTALAVSNAGTASGAPRPVLRSTTPLPSRSGCVGRCRRFAVLMTDDGFCFPALQPQRAYLSRIPDGPRKYMRITDISDFISPSGAAAQAPDLILIAVLLANVWLGARRGLVGALYGVIGRIGMIAASVAAAKYTAPYIAQWVVVPAVGQLFEKQAAPTAEGVLDGLRQTVTEAAVGMSESIAFSMLVVLFSVLFGTAHLDFRPQPQAHCAAYSAQRTRFRRRRTHRLCKRRRIRLHPADRVAVSPITYTSLGYLCRSVTYAAAQTACGRFTYRHLMENTLILHFPLSILNS